MSWSPFSCASRASEAREISDATPIDPRSIADARAATSSSGWPA
jgi:hypothetical protein